jgi:hypothetical protein
VYRHLLQVFLCSLRQENYVDHGESVP